MESDNSFKEVNIRLKKIQDHKFYYNLEFECDSEKLDEEKFPCDVEIKYHISHDLEEDLFNINLLICYKKDKTLILEAENRFVFCIKNLKDFINVRNDTTISLNVDFLPTLINVAIGTMRGIIYSRTGSSSLSDFPLPLISMNELMNKAHPTNM